MSACRRDKSPSSANDAECYIGALSLEVGAPVACPGRAGAVMRDGMFLVGFALVLVVGAQLYAATGWPMPGLIDKGD